MDRGAWQATVHGVAKSQARMSNYNSHSPFACIIQDAVTFLHQKRALIYPMVTSRLKERNLFLPIPMRTASNLVDSLPIDFYY